MRFQRILFPTDFSEGALNALPYVIDLATQYKAKVYLLNVIYDLEKAVGFFIPHTSVDLMYQELEKTVHGELERFGLPLRDAVRDVEYVVLRGVPYEEILTFAEKEHMDLIVMSTHGRKGLDRVLFGSTAEKIVRNASCPLFIVRGPGG